MDDEKMIESTIGYREWKAKYPNGSYLEYRRSGGGAPEVKVVKIKAEGAVCLECPLRHTPFIDGTRGEPADVVGIGEAGGRNELEQQEFFVGKAGQLLKATLEQVGLTIGFNNTVLCYPDGPPPAEAIACCRERLLQELRDSHPKVIVPLGAVALKALTGINGISDVQGLVVDYKLYDFADFSREELKVGDEEVKYLEELEMVKMVPCYHPAALLRRPELFYDFAQTLSKVKMVAEGYELANIQPEDFVTHIVGADDLIEVLRILSDPELNLSADLETTNLIPYTGYIICISIAAGRSGEDGSRPTIGYTIPWELFEDPQPGEAYETLKTLLETRSVNYFNGAFDCQFLREFGINAWIGSDTMLKHYTLDERTVTQGLKHVAKVYCNAPDWEEPLKPFLPNKNTSFAAVPKDVLFEYAALDSCYTGTLDLVISDLMDANDWRVYNDILLPAANMLLDVTSVGLKIDLTKLDELRIEYIAKIQYLEEELVTMAGYPGFNPRSVKDCKWLLYNKVGIRGNGSTARQVLEAYPNVPEAALLIDFRSTQKILGTYLEGLLDDIVNGRIHPNLRLNGTVTGRLSARNPNMLGMPKEKGGVKKLFVADEGFVLLELDGKGMELWHLAALSNDPAMKADMGGGRDFHGEARNRLFGRGASKDNYNHQEVLDAKMIVFGPIYGRGAPSLAAQLKCAVSTAQEWIDAIWGKYPIAFKYLKDRLGEVRDNGEVLSHYGRKRRWGLITPDNLKDVDHESRNFAVSSPSSDTNLLCMLSIYNTFPSTDVLPLLPIHDAVLMSVNESKKDELIPAVCKLYRETAQRLMKTDMTFHVDAEVGKSWGEMEEVR